MITSENFNGLGGERNDSNKKTLLNNSKIAKNHAI